MSDISPETVAAALLDLSRRGGNWGVRTLRKRGKGSPRSCGYQVVSAGKLAEAAGRLLSGDRSGTAGMMATECVEIRLTGEGLEIRASGRVYQVTRATG